MSKRGFFIVLLLLTSLLCGEVYFLSLRTNKSEALKNFVEVSTIFSPAFYSNSFTLRHRDLQNSNILTPFHPSLREFEVGTFVQNYIKSDR